MSITLHRGDLPAGLDLGDVVAVDSETMGLQPARDRLCVVQLSAGDGTPIWCSSPGRLCRAQPAPPARRSRPAQAVPLRPLRPRRAAPLPGAWSAGRSTCTKIASRAGPHLHRPARAEGPRPRAPGHRARQGRAELGLGRADLSETQLPMRARDVLHLHALRAGSTSMLAARAQPSGAGLLRVPAGPRRARPRRLARTRTSSRIERGIVHAPRPFATR